MLKQFTQACGISVTAIALGLALSHLATPLFAQEAFEEPVRAAVDEPADMPVALAPDADAQPTPLRAENLAALEALEQNTRVLEALSAYQAQLLEAARARPEILLERADLSALCQSDPYQSCSILPFTLGNLALGQRADHETSGASDG